jgi:hypothetical protein
MALVVAMSFKGLCSGFRGSISNHRKSAKNKNGMSCYHDVGGAVFKVQGSYLKIENNEENQIK